MVIHQVVFTLGSSEQIEGLNLYNDDGSVNESAIADLDKILTTTYLKTTHHHESCTNYSGCAR